MPKILITGCSSGFGLAIAQKFLDTAGMSSPPCASRENDLLSPNDRLEILPLDVTSADSIAKAIEAAGSIDALVQQCRRRHAQCA